MTTAELLVFLRRHRLCVVASASPSGAPQSAVVGFAVSDRLDFVFDTLATSRKAQNIARDRRVALVVGWDDEQTAQIEGVADEPRDEELADLKQLYFGVYPDGIERQSWPHIQYVRVRPNWVRYSDFRPGTARVVEFSERKLRA